MTAAQHAQRDRRVRAHRADDGFTLIELLVVLGIIVMLASFVGPQVLRYLGKARSETARAQISAIVSSLELFALDNGGYPSAEAGLRALVEPPQGAPRWSGPYLKKKEGLIDPWGRNYLYRVPGASQPFDVITLGRDNAAGGTGEDQDVSN